MENVEISDRKTSLKTQEPIVSPHDPLRQRHNQHQRTNNEPEKIALDTSFPWIEFGIHAAALAIIVALLWANFAKVFWRDFELRKTRRRNVELKAWQFGAKVHELFMLASLSFIVFYYMRRLLVGKRGIPFGLVSAPYLIASPGMLISKPFRAGFNHHFSFGMLLMLLCLLSVVLGPSSAIAMIPSLGWFHMANAFQGGQSVIHFYNGSGRELWPAKFNSTTTGLNATEAARCRTNPYDARSTTDSCPSSGFLDILKWFRGYTLTDARNSLLFTDFYSSAQRQVSVTTIPGGTTEAYATVATELTSMSLGTFYNYARRNNLGRIQDVSYPRLRFAPDTPIYQPVVYVNCMLNIWAGEWDRDNISFPGVHSAWRGSYSDGETYVDADSDIFNGLPDPEPRFDWFKGSRQNASASLNALAIVPIVTSNKTTNKDQPSSAIIACSIDARWAASEVSYQPMNSSTVSSNVSETLRDTLRDYDRHRYGVSDKPIDLGLDWATYLNGNQTGSSGNRSAIALFLYSAITQLDDNNANSTTFFVPNVTTGGLAGAAEEATAMLLSVVIADGIGRTVSNPSHTYPFLAEEAKDGMMNVTLLQIYLLPDADKRFPADTSSYTVPVYLDQYGYGYGFRNGASWFALASLLLYALIVCVHGTLVLKAFFKRQYYGGGCWEDVTDLVALAVNSAPTDRLYGTSAGVKMWSTWQNTVKIREVSDRHLELCFVDRQVDIGESVQVGKKYL